MPANTPILGLPYPLPTDPLMDGADAIRLLAEAIEAAQAEAAPPGGGEPASPSPGDRWLLGVPYDNGAKLAHWEFVWDEASDAGKPWAFLGGPMIVASYYPQTGWPSDNFAAMNAALVCPIAGDYEILYGAAPDNRGSTVTACVDYGLGFRGRPDDLYFGTSSTGHQIVLAPRTIPKGQAVTFGGKQSGSYAYCYSQLVGLRPIRVARLADQLPAWGPTTAEVEVLPAPEAPPAEPKGSRRRA